MKRIFSLLSAHMVLAAVLFSLHHWVAVAKNRGDYSPFAVSSRVSAMTFDETHAYAPPAQRFMSVGQIPAEVDNYERRDSSAGIPFVPAAILGGMGRVLGNLDRAFIAVDVLFPALAFGLLYAASKGILQSPVSRLLLAWGGLLVPFRFEAVSLFLWRGFDARFAPADFTRTPQPEMSFPLLLLALLVSVRLFHSAERWTSLVVSGLVSALVVYSYYFYALAWGMTLVMLLVLTVVWGNWAAARRLVVTLSVMIAASLPYIVATLRGRVEGGQTYLLDRMGAHTHAPRVFALLCFVLGFFLVWKFGRRLFEGQDHQVRIGMFILLLLSGLAGLNFQVLSGYDAQHLHFVPRLILPVSFFLCGSWLLSAAERLKGERLRAYNAVAVVALIGIVLNAGARQAYVGARIADEQRASRPESELLGWVRSNLPFGSVIGSVDPDLILLIPSLGPNFTYVPAGLRSLSPMSEIIDRYYELASLFGLSEADVKAIATLPNHVFPSQLLTVLSYAGTPHTFSESYGRYRQEQNSPVRRLDYVVCKAGEPIPEGIAGRFVHARVLHVNPGFQLIGLR